MKKTTINICLLILFVTLFHSPFKVMASSVDNSNDTIITSEDVQSYCNYYGIPFSSSKEFFSEVSCMIKDRNSIATRSSSTGGKESRYIPSSYLGDIIWTNNPISPFNHVGIYTATNKITEALDNGVVTRTVAKNMDEYPFKIYKVTTTPNGTTRYALSYREAAGGWARVQVGKAYDYNYENNKLNNTSSNSKMNCSELVYKAWKYNDMISVDLDSNGGTGVYPNNIQNSDYTALIYTDN